MAESNKFAGNFLSLLDDFKAKKPGNKNEEANSERKKSNANSSSKESHNNDNSENLGNASKFKRKKQRDNRSPKDGFVENPALKSEENISDQFFSMVDNIESKMSQNTKNKKFKEKDTSLVDSDSKTTPRNRSDLNDRNNDGKKSFDDSKKDGHSRGWRSNISDSNNQAQRSNERVNKSREPETWTKRANKPMGYKFLESLLDKETSFVLTTLASPRSGFQELVNETPIRPDLLMLIIKVFDKINYSEAQQLKVQIFSNTFRPEFVDELKKFFSQICIDDNRTRLMAMNTFFVNVLNVLDTVVNSFPSIMNERMKSTLNTLNLAMLSVKDEHHIQVSEELFSQLKELTNQVSSYIEHRTKTSKEHRYNVNRKEIPPPNNYRDIPLIPTEEDLTTDGYLRQNIVRGSYRDVDHYLDIQFRLLREDFIAPLREGILEYVVSLNTPQSKRRYSNVRIYPKVKFDNPVTSRDVFGFDIQFDCDKRLPRNINWEYNKRFMPGSLLLLSDNNFQTFYLATVVERKIDKLQKGKLFITFVPGTDIPEYLVNPGVFFVMAESEVYYEAYKHVLSALQRMNEKNFPMKQYIVDVDTTCFPPAHLVDNSVYKISKFDVNLLDDKSWPSPEDLNLNLSQHQALKSALTNDFVVIQGPPGTGKTFLALKITEILLKNQVSFNTPIVVICYTNHALDQFLEGILKYTKNLIRIGMQSQNETLQLYNLEEVRKKMKEARNTNYSALFRETMDQKRGYQYKLQAIKDNIEQLSNPVGILDIHVLRSVITPLQYNLLSEDPNVLLSWLFCYDDPEFQTKERNEGSNILDEILNENDKPKKELDTTNFLEEATNVTYNPEEELEEFDDEENARRLADMKEDDFYEEDFFDENYDSELSYSLSFDAINAKINQIRNDFANREYESQDAKYYYNQQCKQQIDEMNWQAQVMHERFERCRGYVFNPDRFQLFQNVGNLWDIDANDRWEYYITWVYLYMCQLKQVVQHYTKIYQDIIMRLHELRQLEDVRFVQTASVVGLTTSGAAKRRVLLENLGTRIVIVEEAAEVLEAHIVTSLAPSVQHVILIGDHKQLKPNPAVFKLAKKYNMDCSLFERMLNNGLGCSVLNEQHRMRPEIASLISPTIYPQLANHPSTLNRSKVRGIDKFVFFLTHDKPEDQLPDSSSKQNTHEADILMELCKYLLLNDYKPEEITILATYTGQVWYMRKKKKEMGLTLPDMKAVRITPVDNYQGEENRIILLSLVRSNRENKIGFLSTENRVCVALSRAKEGLYVVGNMDNLTNSSSIWPKIKQTLESINAFGQRLLLRCERHPEQLTEVSHANDFKAVPDGGCRLKCNSVLPNCGHICPRICHIIDKDHCLYKCQQKCERPPCDVEGHKCPLKCWRNCEPCIISVEKLLPCGHTATLACHQEPANHKCLEIVPAIHPACNHEITKFCYLDVNHCRCTNNCSFRLPCGHACNRNCHVNDDPDHLQYNCFKDCAKEFTGCAKKLHKCKKRCYEDCGDCLVLMPTTLPCGHHYEIPCSSDPNTFQCKRHCKRTMTCGHKCKALCWVECDPNHCNELVDKLAPCGHIMTKIKCNEGTDKRVCKENCQRKLSCGHPCPDKCFKDCKKVRCNEEVDSPVKPRCGHSDIKIPCFLAQSGLNGGSDELLELCEHPCGKLMRCGHTCEGTCGACLQGRLHVPCDKPCNKTLVCGHKCGSTCSVLCPPCKARCPIQCSHKKCFDPQDKRKQHWCNRPCPEYCNKRCEWKCEHLECKRRCWEMCDRLPCLVPCPRMLDCDHPCMGYCGEPCPPTCAVCDPNILVANSIGDRYVVLQDCEHVVLSCVIDKMIIDTKNDVISMHQLVCPHEGCLKPIINTMRYRNVYLNFRKQVLKIEETVATNETIRLKKMYALQTSLLGSDPTNNVTMNVVMKMCSHPFKGNRGQGMDQKDMGRLIVGVLLQPLAVRCKDLSRYRYEITTEYGERLKLRLGYLATALIKRMDQISYEAILQIELVIANILQLASEDSLIPPTTLSWFDVEPWTWEKDTQYNQRKPIRDKPISSSHLSVTLITRDGNKKWFECVKGHMYVAENTEVCDFCKIEEEEEQRLKEEQQRLKEERKKEEAVKNAKKQPRNEHKNWKERERQGPHVTDWRRGGRGGRGGGRGNRGNPRGGNRGYLV